MNTPKTTPPQAALGRLARRLGCAALLGLSLAAAPLAHALASCGNTNQIIVNNHRISAWKLNYSGTKDCRYYDNTASWMEVDLAMTGGGYDAGIGKNIASGKKCDSMAIGIGVQATMVITTPSGGGHWWAGPKTIISSTASYSGLTGQYECYIIEKAEKTPSQLVSYMGGTYRGEGTFDGSVYKHYTVVYEGINQIWSIRQNYRNGGWTSVGYIQKQWRTLGLVPNWYNLGWKYNVEFNGANTGKIKFQSLSLPYN
jgi:hypothetical protein